MPLTAVSSCDCTNTAWLALRTCSTSDAFVLAEEVFDRLERQLRRDLATPMPAHAVGHRVERRLDQVGVLVALADPADVGGHPHLDLHRRSSITVVPIRTLSPACTMAGEDRR